MGVGCEVQLPRGVIPVPLLVGLSHRGIQAFTQEYPCRLTEMGTIHTTRFQCNASAGPRLPTRGDRGMQRSRLVL